MSLAHGVPAARRGEGCAAGGEGEPGTARSGGLQPVPHGRSVWSRGEGGIWSRGMFSSVISPDNHPLPGYRCRRIAGLEAVTRDFQEPCGTPAPAKDQFETGDESEHDGPGYLGPSCSEKGDTQHPKARSGAPAPLGLRLPEHAAEPPRTRCPAL